MEYSRKRVLLISTVDVVQNSARAVIKLFLTSFSSFSSSLTIYFNRFGFVSRIFATCHRLGANILHIVSYAEMGVIKNMHKILNIVDRVNNPSFLAIALVITLAFGFFEGPRRMNEWTNSLTSKTLSRGMERHGWRTHIRKLFREATLTVGGSAPNVLHPKPRRDRKTAIQAMTHIISQTAVHKPYHLQARPCQIGDDHRMQHFWASDTSVLHNDTTEITPEHIVTQIDSDYYVDMNSRTYLPYNPQLIYTFDPTEVASKHTEYPAWTFVDEATIEVTSPAEHYRHKLWNFTGNEIRLLHIRSIWNAEFQIYELEKRRIDRTHSLVLVNPRVRYTGFYAYLARFWFGSKPLKRVNVGRGDYAKMEIQHQEQEGTGKHTVSISRKGDTLASTCDILEYQQMFELTMRSKLGCTVPKVKTKTQLTDAPAALLTNYLNDLKKEIEGPKEWYKNYNLEYAIRIHQYYPNTAATTDPNPAVVAFANALFDACYVHSNELGSEIQAIESRLTKLIRPFTMTAKHTQYMDAFILRLVQSDIRHSLIPCDDDEVFEHQNKPTQQTILEYALEVNVSDGEPVISTFAKKEAAGKINDTRIISVGKPANKLRTSKYLYPFAKWLKKQKWYCFGKTPKELAEHLAKTAHHAKTMNCTDFSRMDGRKNIALRTFNYKLMVALFGPNHALEIRELYVEGCHARGFTPTINGECFFFKTYMAWASGDPFTSSFNSVDNALIVFTGYVNKYTDDGKIQVDDDIFDLAYNEVVASANIAGDDTALANMPDTSIVQAATWWGHVLKSEVYTRGQAGVNFLARVYGPDLWEGDANSCTDLKRALSKLHVTPNLKGFTPIENMSMKLTSLKFTDGDSPIIKELIDTWLMIGGKLADRYNSTFMSYWSQYEITNQYPNRREHWMFETLPGEGLEVDWELFECFTTRVTCCEDFLQMPTIWSEEESKPLPGQQVVQTIADEQDFVGPDEHRLEQPTKQELPDDFDEIILKPPTDDTLQLVEFCETPSRVDSAEAEKDIKQDKGKERAEEQSVPNTKKPSPSNKGSRYKESFVKKQQKADPSLTKKQINKLYTEHLKNERKKKLAANPAKQAS